MYVICLAVLPIAALADQKSCSQPRWVEFGAPLASGTVVSGINNLGEVAGYYQDTNYAYHAYVRTPDGRITLFDAPNALTVTPWRGTSAFSINDFGATTGRFPDQQSIRHSFVRNPDGHITVFEAPGADITDPFQGTSAWSINLLGAIAGDYLDPGGNQHGFVRSPRGAFTEFDPSGAVFGYTYVAAGGGINLAGAVIGGYAGVLLSGVDINIHGYVRRPDGTITGFDADPNDTGTFPSSINIWGAITGSYNDANYVSHGFVRTPDGQITSFDVPGAATIPGLGTSSASINALGVIVGQFFDANVVSHGFIRSPGGNFTILDAPGANTVIGSGAGTGATGVNLLGTVTGSYTDTNGVNHGFVYTPCTK
jgi:hypothetical protein